jgi:NADPH:quinone reductase-like Zn-dependent oxidoreductase
VGKEEVCINGGIIGVATNGGFAEYAVVPARNTLRIPRGVNLEEAATFPVGALTAWHMVITRAGAGPGELVVIFGARGNVGVYAVQFAKMAGATVVAVTKMTKAVGDRLRELGADYVTSPMEVEGLVKELTGGVGADLVVDLVGQATWGVSYGMVGRYGRWVSAGAISGGDVNLSIPSLYGKEATIIGSTGGNREELNRILQLASRGKVKAPIYARYSLDKVKDAFEAMWKAEDRVGKVLLEI